MRWGGIRMRPAVILESHPERYPRLRREKAQARLDAATKAMTSSRSKFEFIDAYGVRRDMSAGNQLRFGVPL